jgi:hypothetical protein
LIPEKENPQFDEALTGESKPGVGGDAAALPARLSRYSKAHHRAVEMAHYATGKGEVKIAKQLHDCGAWLMFRDYYRRNEVRLSAANFCRRHLLCPLCAIRRGAKALQLYLDKLEQIRQVKPNLKAYMVTLTVKDGPDLLERYNHLHRSVQKLHKMRHGTRQTCEARKASGAVWSYEFKRGKNSGEWHPHVHAVWLCEERPDVNLLRQQWQHITKDSHVLHVQEFHDQEQLVEGFLEVFKYAVKFSDLPMADNWHGFEVLKGRRLIASFGDFYGIEMPDTLTDDQLDNEPFVEMLYRFIEGVGYNFEGYVTGGGYEPGSEAPDTRPITRSRDRKPINWHAVIMERGIRTFERRHLAGRWTDTS